MAEPVNPQVNPQVQECEAKANDEEDNTSDISLSSDEENAISELTGALGVVGSTRGGSSGGSSGGGGGGAKAKSKSPSASKDKKKPPTHMPGEGPKDTSTSVLFPGEEAHGNSTGLGEGLGDCFGQATVYNEDNTNQAHEDTDKTNAKDDKLDETTPLLKDDKPKPVVLKKLFKAQKGPAIYALAFEFMIVLTFTQWGRIGHSKLEKGESIMWDLRLAYWCTFFGFLALRAITLAIWKHVDVGKKACTIASFYMFCSSVQFILYIAFYYEMNGRLTSAKLSEFPKVDYALDPNNPEHFIEECLAPYWPKSCDGHVMIGGEQCCVVLKGTLHTIMGVVPGGFMTIAHAFALMKWICVLVMTWVWMDVPLVKFTAADKTFVGGVWLDILDCLMFTSYLEHPATIFPNFGLVGSGPDKGRPCESALGRACEGSLYYYVWTAWIVAMTTSILAPAVYTAVKYLDPVEDKKDDVEDAFAKLQKHVKLLNEKRCRDDLDELLQKQTKSYMKNDLEEGVTSHRVHTGRHKAKRLGEGIMHETQCGMYHVKHDSNDEPKEADVMVTDLRPDMTHVSHPCGKKCCHGWLRVQYLFPEKDKNIEYCFERRAGFVNAARSAFCLEIPFLILRFYFDVYLGHGLSIFFLKNLVFAVTTFLTVLACGKEEATCCNHTPIKSTNKIIKGSKLSKIMIGPDAMFRLATELYQNGVKQTLEDEKASLEAQKTWVVVERKRMLDAGKGQSGDTYHDALKKLQDKIDLINKQEKTIHV